MGRLLKRLILDNGLVLEITDESSNYYAEFWNLKVVIRGKVKVRPEYLQGIVPSNPSELKAKKALGEEVEYYRELTQLGVRETELGEDRRRLLQYFEENSLPYLQHPSFPERMVRKRWLELTEETRVRRSMDDEDD
ncbi:MAG: hypothetical protein JSW32_00650 [Deltaproteobacteria bacterium]|nr:MAG: hypothetical protein JSW32_00650 [Deltaproteobacteria bacterium]